MTTLLKVSGVSVVADAAGGDGRVILQDIEFELASGQILGVIGEAGSGKTVLARTLVRGIAPPLRVTSGEAWFCGCELLHCDTAELRRIRGNKIGYIGPNPMGSLDPRATIGAQILEKLRTVRPDLSAAEAKETVLETLSAVHIPSPATRFHEFPFQFSGGMMQRVMIVDALVTQPVFLVADDITQALDVTVAVQIIRLIKELCSKFGTAILFISSSLPTVVQIAEKALVLQDGRIVEAATPQRLVTRPDHAYTRELVAKLPKIWSGNTSAPQRAAGSPILTVRNVFRTYRTRRRGTFRKFNEVKAVRGTTFEVTAGENLGIVGESGCGKSTLARLLAWLEKPDSGEILFESKALSGLSFRALKEMRRSFQLLLQDPYGSLPPGMPVARIIAESLLIHGASLKQARIRASAVMQEVGLGPELANQLTVGLSAGQRQRINIARALVLNPKLLILDETLTALDQIEQSELLALFARLQQSHSLSYIFISHDLALVRKMCHRIAVMYLGKIVEIAENASLFEAPRHPYTRALLSAVPTLESNPFPRSQLLLDGEPPSPINLPTGCTFYSRCPMRTDICRQAEPELSSAQDGGEVACYFAGSVVAVRLAAAEA